MLQRGAIIAAHSRQETKIMALIDGSTQLNVYTQGYIHSYFIVCVEYVSITFPSALNKVGH